jgi:hypothetical protein
VAGSTWFFCRRVVRESAHLPPTQLCPYPNRTCNMLAKPDMFIEGNKYTNNENWNMM